MLERKDNWPQSAYDSAYVFNSVADVRSLAVRLFVRSSFIWPLAAEEEEEEAAAEEEGTRLIAVITR